MISFVYFDVGGVVIRDFSARDEWEKMRRDMEIQDTEAESFRNIFKKYADAIVTSTHVDTLIPEIEKSCHIKFPEGYSLLADFVDRFKKNPSIHPIIQEIAKICRVGFLTDQYVGMLDMILEKELIPAIHWNIIVDSTKVGFRKPDRKIFEIAQKLAGVSGNEILFVENSMKNITAAKDFGWQTFYYDSSDYEKSSKVLHSTFQSLGTV